jgi:polar amino acid transport system substrate-binding protein
LAPKKAALKNWEQLKDQKICAIEGAWYNKTVAEKYGAQIVAFKGQTETGLLQGNCVGWLFDDTAFLEILAEAKLAAFEMPLETILIGPWGTAIKLDERDGPWEQFMSQTVTDWHRSGKLIALETKWHIPLRVINWRLRSQ